MVKNTESILVIVKLQGQSLQTTPVSITVKAGSATREGST